MWEDTRKYFKKIFFPSFLFIPHLLFKYYPAVGNLTTHTWKLHSETEYKQKVTDLISLSKRVEGQKGNKLL